MEEIPKSCLIVCGGLGGGILIDWELTENVATTLMIPKIIFLIANKFLDDFE